MQLLTVVLGRPGTIGFATGLAHPRAPNLWGKQGWYTGQGIIAWDLTHGNYGSTTWTDSFVDSLLEQGCAVLRVNNRGHDPMSRVVVGEDVKRLGAAYEGMEDCRYDWEAWVDFAQVAGYQRIGLWGH